MDITKTIKSIIILDFDGKRILSKNFDPNADHEFERKLFAKTKMHRAKDDILVLDGMLIIHKFITDLHLYAVGNRNENPLILESVLNCLIEVIKSILTNKTVERQTLMDHLTPVIIALDEICDNGIVLETDSNLVLQRVVKDTSEQTMTQKLQNATEHLPYIKIPWIRS